MRNVFALAVLALTLTAGALFGYAVGRVTAPPVQAPVPACPTEDSCDYVNPDGEPGTGDELWTPAVQAVSVAHTWRRTYVECVKQRNPRYAS